MENNTPPVEISISENLTRIKQFFYKQLSHCILFVKKYFFIFLSLFIIGVVLGYFIDKGPKPYKHQVIIQPNFLSTDYLYNKIDLIQSKIERNDTLFLKQLHISPKVTKIEIEPVVDIYQFTEGRNDRYEVLKLMSEESSMSEIITNEVTSRNYKYHLLEFTTAGTTTWEKTIQPIVEYFNNTKYFNQLREVEYKNYTNKIAINDSTVAQIDAFLAKISSPSYGNSLYTSENTNLAEIFTEKGKIVAENAYLKRQLVGMDKVIKEVSYSLNMKQRQNPFTKAKVLLPLLFWTLFAAGLASLRLYRKIIAQNQNTSK